MLPNNLNFQGFKGNNICLNFQIDLINFITFLISKSERCLSNDAFSAATNHDLDYSSPSSTQPLDKYCYKEIHLNLKYIVQSTYFAPPPAQPWDVGTLYQHDNCCICLLAGKDHYRGGLQKVPA